MHQEKYDIENQKGTKALNFNRDNKNEEKVESEELIRKSSVSINQYAAANAIRFFGESVKLNGGESRD